MVEIIHALGPEVFKQMFGDSPKLVALLDTKFSGSENEEPRRQLFENVDDSDYSLRQWVESVRILESWLDGRGLQMATEDQLGYIRCAAESGGAGAQLSHLPSLVVEMLEAYGCERASRAQAEK